MRVAREIRRQQRQYRFRDGWLPGYAWESEVGARRERFDILDKADEQGRAGPH